jgi:tocopherol O-methyltransferase
VSGDLSRYYDWLSRYQRLTSSLGLGGGYDTLTVHRIVNSEGPGASTGEAVHERLLAVIGSPTAPHVIDAGCGLGGTIFFLHSRLGGRYDGLTLSRVQRARAVREAARRGIAEACRFHVRSYDGDLSDLAPAGADLIVAIESLAHAVDPSATIAGLARVLRRDGQLIVIDDMPSAAVAADDPDFAAFRKGWHTPAIASRTALRSAIDAAGLSLERDDDWTASVPRRDPGTLERLVSINRGVRWLAGPTAAAVVLDALHGGLMLERLYRRGLVEYRLLSARRVRANPDAMIA